jgi:molecular chaperone DnaJ
VADDYYELLGVSRTATQDEVKRAYRRLARELHPDTGHGDPEAEAKFKQVTAAYEVLRDPEKRQRYDTYGPEGAAASAGGAGDPFGFGGINDVFEAFFGGSPFGGRGGRGPVGPPRGADVEVVADLDFEQAVFGTQHTVVVRTPVACTTCEATGAAPGSEARTCTVCQGTGQVQRVRQSLIGQMVTASPCHQCGGLGPVIADPCPDCRGEGRKTEERKYTVDIPAGVDSGSTLRLSGRGAAGPRGGGNGDLYVHLRVKPHERFQRDGVNLVSELRVPYTQAVLGASVPFETLDGTEVLELPRATPSGKVFRLRGKGVQHIERRSRGDILVTVVVDVPTELSDTEEEALRRFAELRDEDVAPPPSGLFGKIRSAFQ